MTTQLIVTLIGADRPGIVDRVARAVSDCGGNWEASRMSRLAGRFAGILLVSVPGGRAGELRDKLAALDDLQVITEPSDPGADLGGQRLLHLALVGTDRAGIVHEISHALAQQGVSVVELSTNRSPAPMAGGTLFHLEAQLRCPAAVNDDQLRQRLEALAHELMVDIQLDADAD